MNELRHKIRNFQALDQLIKLMYLKTVDSYLQSSFLVIAEILYFAADSCQMYHVHHVLQIKWLEPEAKRVS
jgi:hypothetical protein